MKVLITGGAGYIGSTICSALEEEGYTPVILDSLINGRVEFTKGRIFYKGDIANRKLLQRIFKENPEIKFTIHCAALIIVPESVEKPYEYYLNNIAKSIELFKNLKDCNCCNIIFSSSASIYATTPNLMVKENSPIEPKSPYARTKFIMEMILSDFCSSYGMYGIALRYFNPIGADPKMRSGMYATNPTHILGKLINTATGKEKTFNITGTNWPTRDGTGIRDYIHVWDLAKAHVNAIKYFDRVFKKSKKEKNHYMAINIGTKNGVSVKEMADTFEKVWGKPIKKKNKPPRPGDVAGAYANVDLARRLIKWKTRKTLEEDIRDALKWEKIKKIFYLKNIS